MPYYTKNLLLNFIKIGLLNCTKIRNLNFCHFNFKRFTINLMCGPYDGSDIALHCDVRLRVGGDFNVVLRNSCQGGGWGAEERHSPYFPFMPNANFDMIIMAEQHQFKVPKMYKLWLVLCFSIINY